MGTKKNTGEQKPPVATKTTAPVEVKAQVVAAPVEGEVVAAAPFENNAKPLEAKASKELIEKMLPYQEAYPANKVFYITSDGQVFLDSNKLDAELHEKTLGGTLTPFGE